MSSLKVRQTRLLGSQLYLILDTDVCEEKRLFQILKQAVRSGVDIVQLRDKIGPSRATLRLATQISRYLKNKVLFIVNDRVDMALASGADGVHLGQDDLPLGIARKILGPRMIIGASCQTMAQAKKAQEDGADYIGFGSVYKTMTKPERTPMDVGLLTKAVRQIDIPVFAIGGITLNNIQPLVDLGVRRVAVTRAISLADDVPGTVHAFKKNLFSVS